MVKSIKKQTSTHCSIEEAEEIGKTYSERTNKLEKIEAKMNEEVNKVKDRYSDEITEIKELLLVQKKLLEAYAREHRKNWGDRKTFELLYCKIAFRDSNPKVSKPEEFTWDEVLELLKKNKKFKQFIRVKEEINKEAILSLNASDKKDSSLLKQLKDECYLFIEHPEKFFVTPKKECLN
jgi:phage host-nuclease inhibitor protein Gam